MSRVTSIQLRPSPGAVARAATSAVEITAASCTAHWIAGGMLPSFSWALAGALPLFGFGVLLHRGRLSLPAACVAAAAGQAFLHVVLAQGSPAGHLHAGGSPPSMALPMLTAHVAGAFATVLVWSLRRRAWDVLVQVGQVRLFVLRRPATVLITRADAIDALVLWVGARRRGPPLWVFS